MAGRSSVDPATLRAAVLAISEWLRNGDAHKPARSEIAAAVRLSARSLAQSAPGSSVEVRVPPFVAVQCIEGPRHTRGTPPNIVETGPRTWLLLVTGRLTFAEAAASGALVASGSRADDVEHWLPLLRVD